MLHVDALTLSRRLQGFLNHLLKIHMGINCSLFGQLHYCCCAAGGPHRLVA
jgi:hypothetical protein